MSAPHTIPYSRQVIDAEDIAAVVEVLTSDWITHGPQVARFEAAVAQYCGARFAVAFCNGTAALHAAMLALKIKVGDEGLVPAITFAATANCLAYIGAKPVFTDVVAGIPLMDPASLDRHLTSKTKVIVPVHFAGASLPMPVFHRWAQAKGLSIVEDACHAIGASYQDDGKTYRVGSCAHSDMTVFSFHPVKNMTTGEGGMITTNNPELYDRLKKLRHHGLTFPETAAQTEPWRYEIETLGYNYRMTEMQAALGTSQLNKLDGFLERRRALLKRYAEKLSGVSGLEFLTPSSVEDMAPHLALLLVKPPYSRNRLHLWLKERGVTTQVHYMPLYRHPVYAAQYPHAANQCPQSENYFQQTLSLPLYPTLSHADQDKVVASILDYLKTSSLTSITKEIHNENGSHHRGKDDVHALARQSHEACSRNTTA